AGADGGVVGGHGLPVVRIENVPPVVSAHHGSCIRAEVIGSVFVAESFAKSIDAQPRLLSVLHPPPSVLRPELMTQALRPQSPPAQTPILKPSPPKSSGSSVSFWA